MPPTGIPAVGVSPASGTPLAARPRNRWALSNSPASTRRGTSRQEDPAHDHDPHEAEDGRDEPRIGAVRSPQSTAQPRGAAQQAEDDGRDPGREERARDQPGPPEPERRGHDKTRAPERSQHEACPY